MFTNGRISNPGKFFVRLTILTLLFSLIALPAVADETGDPTPTPLIEHFLQFVTDLVKHDYVAAREVVDSTILQPFNQWLIQVNPAQAVQEMGLTGEQAAFVDQVTRALLPVGVASELDRWTSEAQSAVFSRAFGDYIARTFGQLFSRLH